MTFKKVCKKILLCMLKEFATTYCSFHYWMIQNNKDMKNEHGNSYDVRILICKPWRAWQSSDCVTESFACNSSLARPNSFSALARPWASQAAASCFTTSIAALSFSLQHQFSSYQPCSCHTGMHKDDIEKWKVTRCVLYLSTSQNVFLTELWDHHSSCMVVIRWNNRHVTSSAPWLWCHEDQTIGHTITWTSECKRNLKWSIACEAKSNQDICTDRWHGGGSNPSCRVMSISQT